MTELRRQQRWASVFFTLKDPEDGAACRRRCRAASSTRWSSKLADGERVHVFGRAELYEQRGELRLKALTIERFGLGAHLAALERLKAKLAAEGLFDDSRKRPLPRFPRADRARHRQRRRGETRCSDTHRAALSACERRSSPRRTCRARARLRRSRPRSATSASAAPT